jgi:16S rRNA processing protein RimM
VKIKGYNERVTIGKILKARGIQGEVKVLLLTDIPDRFEKLKSVYVQITKEYLPRVEIRHVRYYKNFAYLQFTGYNSIESVEQFIGCALQVDAEESPELPEGVYYHFEIIGSEVFTDDDRSLGRVTDILETGSYDVYIVRDGEREYLIPSTKEVVTQIDREKREIIVHPLEGLLDL